jgi:predicted DNA binding CopG/RHH family protein
MEIQMTTRQLPRTDSISELARFWDTHDVTDFDDLLEEVTEPVFSKGKDIRIHLKQDEIDSLEKLASERGLEYKELVRKWVLEKLHTA